MRRGRASTGRPNPAGPPGSDDRPLAGVGLAGSGPLLASAPLVFPGEAGTSGRAGCARALLAATAEKSLDPGVGDRRPLGRGSSDPSSTGQPRGLLAAVFLAIVAAEWLSLDFEFRRHAFSCSASELAFVIALIELGGTWTAPDPGGRRRHRAGPAAVQRAEGPLQRRDGRHRGVRGGGRAPAPPSGGVDEPLTWVAYLVAVVAATSVGAGLIAGAVGATQGYPGRALWTSLFIPVLLVGPASVLVGLAILLLLMVTPWAWRSSLRSCSPWACSTGASPP